MVVPGLQAPNTKVAISKLSCQKEYPIPCRGLCPSCDRVTGFLLRDNPFVRLVQISGSGQLLSLTPAWAEGTLKYLMEQPLDCDAPPGEGP